MIRAFPIKGHVASYSLMEPEDTLNTKGALQKLGFYKTPKYGMTPYPDRYMFEGLKAFQDEQNLLSDGTMRAGGPTVRRMQDVMDKMQRAGREMGERSTGPISTVPIPSTDPATPAFRWPSIDLMRQARPQPDRLTGGAGEDEIDHARARSGHPLYARGRAARAHDTGSDNEIRNTKAADTSAGTVTSRDFAGKARQRLTKGGPPDYPAQEHSPGTPPPEYPAKDHRAHRAASAAMPGRTIVEPEPIPQEERERLLGDYGLHHSAYPKADDDALYRLMADLDNVRRMTPGEWKVWRAKVDRYGQRGKHEAFWSRRIITKEAAIKEQPFLYPRTLSDGELPKYREQAHMMERVMGAIKNATGIASALPKNSNKRKNPLPRGTVLDYTSMLMRTGSDNYADRVRRYDEEIRRRQSNSGENP